MKTTSVLLKQLVTLCRQRAAALLVGAGLLCAVESPANILSWSGAGGTDANWSNDANWGFVGHPASGDTLIFSAGQPNFINTNNIGGLTLNQIRFSGAGGGYVIRGSAFTLTNNIIATNTVGANTIENNIALGVTNQTVEVAVALTLSGQLSGGVGLIKTGGGSLTFSGLGANTYSGITRALTGTLALGKSSFDSAIPGDLEVGDATHSATNTYLYANQIGNNAKVTLFDGSLMDMNTHPDGIGALAFNGGTVTGTTGYLALFSPGLITSVSGNPLIAVKLALGTACTISNSATLTISSNIYDFSGMNNITKLGNGSLNLSGSNSFSGLLTISQGFVFVNNPFALGTTNSGVVVSNAATLAFLGVGSFGITNESLSLNGAGVPSYGALDSENSYSTNVWAGPVTVNAPGCQIVSYWSGSQIRIAGPITGSGGINIWTGSGTNASVVFEGATANTYAGATTVDSGTLVLGKSASTVAVPQNLVLSGSSSLVRLANDEQTTSSTDVQLNAGSLFDFGTFYTYVDELSGSGTVNFGSGGWISVSKNNGSSTFDGQFTGLGYAPGWSVGVEGSGTFTMNGNNTFSQGNYTVYGPGKMVMNGFHPRPPVLINGGAAFGGSGTVGNIEPYEGSFGTLAPGSSLGLLTSSNVTFTAAGNFTVELAGPMPGIDYDQLNIRGTNVLANASLTVLPTFTTPVAIGQQFIIMNNDGSATNVGTFNGLAQGASINTGGYQFTISYTGNSGNDVVLTLADVPSTALGSLSTITSGNGNGTIDPNECNGLSVVITNKTGTSMTGVSATLASTTAGVIVTETTSPFSNVPGNGKGTNTVPFQVTTTTNFVCGSPINLLLSVTTASHGAFIVPVTLTTGSPAVVPVRFDNNTTLSVPDVSTVESTNNVAVWTGGPLTKVAVSLWLGAPFDGDLNLTLIAPDGSTVDLSSGNGGSGVNYGTGSADGSRTIFDDAAATSITTGTAPFVGTFRPEASLASLIGTTPVTGNWRLRIQDTGFFGAPDTLRNWSLFLYGTECETGSGLCELCPNVTITSALGPNSPTQVGYLASNGTSICGVAKTCPGTISVGPYPTENFTFRNGPSDACISVTLSNISNGAKLSVGAFSQGFNPANPDRCVNYLADSGLYPSAGNSATFAFNVSSNATFVINVLGGSYGAFVLTVTGGDCRPALNITALSGDKARLDWTTAATGFQLESTNVLDGSGAVWPAVTNLPVVINSRYTVTNAVPASQQQFYQLRKSMP